MEVINKLYSSVSSTVSNTVSQLSTLLGNPITKEYEVGEHIGSAGPGLCWKVYKGTKRTTKQNVSVFVFDKNQLKYTKDDRETILEMLKRGVTQLTKIRHPRILTVQHPLEESRDSIAFVTEPILASLSNVLGNHTNMPQLNESNQFPQLHEIEIKYGLIQMMEGLQFLHADMKMIHRNICPESVIVNIEGGWKLFGFDYCCVLSVDGDTGQVTGSQQTPYIPQNRNSLLQPLLDYAAPEWIIDSKQYCSSDIWSLGVLIYTIHSTNKKPIKLFGTNVEQFKVFAMDIKLGKYPNMSCISPGIVDYVRLMIHYDPEQRPSLYELPKIPYFDDFGVKTLSYLESLYQWDNLQKSKFFKGLPQILEKFPERINRKQILPCLARELVNATMVPFVLPNILLIAKQCPTQAEYLADVQRHLLPIMKIESPIHILLIFMQNMELLIKLSTAQVIKHDLLSMCNRALECDMKEIQELCLAILPLMATHLDFAVLKNGVFPRIRKLCLNTQQVSVKVNCLLCLGKLLEFYDKWFALDEIIPFLTQIPSRDPAVLMAVIGIFKLVMSHKKLGMTKEIMATRVIPFLVPLSIENGLTLSQFNAIMTMIKEIIGTIELEHRSKLEQLNSVRQEAKLTAETSAAAFPEFNLDEFKSSCLNSSGSSGQQSNKTSEMIMPASTSMPTIPVIKSPPTASTITANKPSPTPSGPPTASIPPSISFPAQLQQASTTFQPMAATLNAPSQLQNAFNANFLNGFGGSNPMGNTRVPMNQMNFTQPTTAAAPSMGNSLLSFNTMNNNSGMMSPLAWTNASSAKNGSTDKAVALSAQEINDFLS